MRRVCIPPVAMSSSLFKCDVCSVFLYAFRTTTTSMLNVSEQNFLLLNVTIFNESLLLKWTARTSQWLEHRLCLLYLLPVLPEFNIKPGNDYTESSVATGDDDKQSTLLAWRSCSTAGLIVDSLTTKLSKLIQQNHGGITFTPRYSSSFSKPGAYITHNAIKPLRDITWRNESLQAASSGSTNTTFSHAVINTLICTIGAVVL